MVTTHQYPQYLYALQTSEATQNPLNGSWDNGSSEWVLKGICREETNGKGSVINAANGDSIVFSSIIYIPSDMERSIDWTEFAITKRHRLLLHIKKLDERINEGTEIIVTRSEVNSSQLLDSDFKEQARIAGLIIVQGKCLKYDNGRLHCRLWI